MFSDAATRKAQSIIERAAGRYSIATAESCTGGLVAGCLTDIAGSSHVVDRGFVTYSNDAKETMLGVDQNILIAHGAVSEETARAMVAGALAAAPTVDIAVSITGIAGPGGGSAQKPVGLVHFAAQRRGAATQHERHIFDGNRQAIREAALLTALDLIGRQIDE